MRPLLLDLFCCAGGAAKGYDSAGFEAVGVDIDPQPHYPYAFIQADALELLDHLLEGWHLHVSDYGMIDINDIAAIHASPPCQGYSTTKSLHPEASSKYPLLIGPVRDRLRMTGKPWVIENVEGAKAEMINPVTLCGSQFGLTATFNDHPVYLKRHRLFESNFIIPNPGPHKHRDLGRAYPVFGHGPGGKRAPEWMRGPGSSQLARDLMGIDWTTRHELNESIPPYYTEYIGQYLMSAVDAGAWEAEAA